VSAAGILDPVRHRTVSAAPLSCSPASLLTPPRSFAILRNRPITFKKTPSLPRTRHAYEAPDIHSGFRQLISSYVPLDEAFVAAWNDSSDPSVSNDTYLALQDILSRPPAFLTRSRATTPSSEGTARSLQDIITPSSTIVPTSVFDTAQTTTPTKPDPDAAPSAFPFHSAASTEDTDPDPTPIQKADLLITQQWLRLIVWRSSEQRHLLSWSSPHESMDVAFPLEIARSTVSILESLPSTAVEVHGMGIFEKIFKIGAAYIDALSACDSAGPNVGGRLGMGMDFASGGDLGVLGVGRRGFTIDPLEFFVKTLSATPNSRTQFAERLIAHAGRRPGGMKMALSPPPRMLAAVPLQMAAAGVGPPDWSAAPGGVPQMAAGAVLGEVTEEEGDDGVVDPAAEQRTKRSRISGMPVMTGAAQQQPQIPPPPEYGGEFDVGLLSPGVSDHPGFVGGAGIPGLTTASAAAGMWHPVMQHHAAAGSWATDPSQTGGGGGGQHGVQPMDAFSYGPTMTAEEFAYAAFGADGNGNQMGGGGGGGLHGHHGYRYHQQHHSAPGTEPTTPAGDGQGGFGMGLQEGQGTKRGWDGGLGTW